MVTVTLIYPDGSQWIAGGFATVDAANAWIAQAKMQADWNAGAQIEIVDMTVSQANVP